MWIERDELNELNSKHRVLYSEAEKHFSATFLPMLVADGLAQRLPEELANNPLLIESNTGIFVIHVGSIKLNLCERPDSRNDNLFSIHLLSMRGQNCAGMSFYSTPSSLQVEYVFTELHHGPNRFAMMLPNTSEHPLNRHLLRLYPFVVNARSHSVVTPEMLAEISSILK